MSTNEDMGLFSVAGRWIGDSLRRRDAQGQFNWLYQGGYAVTLLLTPDVSRPVWNNFRNPHMGMSFLTTVTFAMFFTFVMTAAITILAGTAWCDDNPATMQFFEDRINLILYIVVCPLYVALCFALIGLAAQYWANRRDSLPESDTVSARWHSLRSVFALFLVLMGASIAIAKYNHDLFFSHDLKVDYWFLTNMGVVRVPNYAGVYYIILNFGLLSISAIGALCYASLAITAMRDAKRFDISDCKDVERRVAQFRPFETATVYARPLALCYIVNTILWSFSKLAGSTQGNILATVLMILVLGWAGTHFPYAYVRRRMNSFIESCKAAGVDPSLINLGPEVPLVVKVVSDTLKVFVGTGFVYLVYEQLDLTDDLKMMLKAFAQ